MASEGTWNDTFGVDEGDVGKALSSLLGGDVEDGDIYFENTVSGSATLDDGVVKRTSSNLRQGVGCRAIAGDRTGYAYTDLVDGKSLMRASKSANAIGKGDGGAEDVGVASAKPSHSLYPYRREDVHLEIGQQIDLLTKIDALARSLDPRVQNVMASIAFEMKNVVIVRADGAILEDSRPLLRLGVSCIVNDKGNRQTGRHGGGGRYAFDVFLEDDNWQTYVREAARRAIVNLDARPAPAGPMSVVLGPGWPGILLHEAVGHGLEGDFNRKGTSAFSGRVGERVATDLCTVVDNGTLASRRGSLNFDDEGTPTQETVLIEKGILKGYLQDRLNGRLMGVGSSGNGRRQSYAHCPMPRMTNTYMNAGDSDPAEILASVKHGIFAETFSGGQVDITSGRFVFSASEAYLIENGKKTMPLKGVTLIGNGPDVLTRVSMVGNDLELDAGVGTCGKDGQSVPVGVGLPTIRVDDLTVGGTGA